jgi:peroxiredoxin
MPPRSVLAFASVVVLACGNTSRPSASGAAPARGSDDASAAARADEPAKDSKHTDGTALIGVAPPEWQVERWINSAPLTLRELRGSVVLVRWWTAGCPFCSATAPALRAFHRTHGERGLKVVGMYHHKEDTPFEPSVYEETAKKYGFTFPIAFDPDWRTFESWMRDANGKPVTTGWTSVTFVLDKRGVVRHFHPGGQYVDGDAAHAKLTAAIERLLAEPASL